MFVYVPFTPTGFKVPVYHVRNEDNATFATCTTEAQAAEVVRLMNLGEAALAAEQTRARDALAQVRELAPRLVRTQVSFWRE